MAVATAAAIDPTDQRMGRNKTEATTQELPRILVVRLSSMGDVIHSMPAVAALREAVPEATIGWMIDERWAELLCSASAARCGPRFAGRPLVDAVHGVNMGAWRRALLSDETWREVLASRREIRDQHYDIAIDLQGAMRTAVMARWVGVGDTIGFDRPREYPASLFYTRRVEARGIHIIEQNVSLVAPLIGRVTYIPKVEFPIDPRLEAWCDQALSQHEVKKFAVVNPGAGWGAKQWPAERYGEVAKGLAARGVRTLINFGPGEEDLVGVVEESSGGAAEGVPCSLGELIALTRRASLFIGGDTGPLHLAAALRIPVVGIFGPTNPARNGPFGTRRIVLRSPESPTTHARRKQPDAGLLAITTKEVLNAAERLLGASS
jgi:heptosyltransferase-1